MIKTYIINGAGGVGKDQFIEFVTDELGEKYTYNISTVNIVKSIAYKIGWKGKKTPQDRKYLSDLKDMMTYWSDLPFNNVSILTELQIEEWKESQIRDAAVFIHCREPNEIDRLVKRLGAETILIIRDTDEIYINHADNEVFNYNYDFIIDNNGTLEELKDSAATFVKRQIKAED